MDRTQIVSFDTFFSFHSFQADTLKERYQKIGDTKRSTPIEVLCENQPGNSYVIIKFISGETPIKHCILYIKILF